MYFIKNKHQEAIQVITIPVWWVYIGRIANLLEHLLTNKSEIKNT